MVVVLAVAGREEERWARRGGETAAAAATKRSEEGDSNGMECGAKEGRRNEDRPTDTRTDPTRECECECENREGTVQALIEYSGICEIQVSEEESHCAHLRLHHNESL